MCARKYWQVQKWVGESWRGTLTLGESCTVLTMCGVGLGGWWRARPGRLRTCSPNFLRSLRHYHLGSLGMWNMWPLRLGHWEVWWAPSGQHSTDWTAEHRMGGLLCHKHRNLTARKTELELLPPLCSGDHLRVILKETAVSQGHLKFLPSQLLGKVKNAQDNFQKAVVQRPSLRYFLKKPPNVHYTFLPPAWFYLGIFLFL